MTLPKVVMGVQVQVPAVQRHPESEVTPAESPQARRERRSWSPPPPPISNPPPASQDTTEEERVAAALRAELQDAKDERDRAIAEADAERARRAAEHEEARAARHANTTSLELKLKGFNLVAIITALGGLGSGGYAVWRQAKPEVVEAQGVRLNDTEKETSEARQWRIDTDKYERAKRAAEDCQKRQISAALVRLGYRLPSLPKPDNVSWLSEYKDDPHQVRRTPQFKPEEDCPHMPSPPGADSTPEP